MGKIPNSIRYKVWELHSERKYDMICPVCNINNISFPNFHCGHIIPDSWGAPIHIANLIPICKDCNLNMGNNYLIDYQINLFRQDTITSRLIHFGLYNQFLEIKIIFQDKILQNKEQKLRKHRCNFVPLNKSVKTCKKMCNLEQEYCTHHEKVVASRLYPDVAPMEID